MSEQAKLPEAVWMGEVTVMGIPLQVAVLEDGKRIIDAKSMEALFQAMNAGNVIDMDPAEYQRAVDFLGGEGIPAEAAKDTKGEQTAA